MSLSPKSTNRQSTTVTKGTASCVQDFKNSSTYRHNDASTNNNNNNTNENRASGYTHFASKSPKPTTRGSSSDRHQTDYGIIINSRGGTRATSRNSTQHGGSIGNTSFNREGSVAKVSVSHLTTASGATLQILGAANGLMKAKAARRRGMLGPEAIILDVNSKMLATMMPGHRREQLEKLGKLEAKYKRKLREQIAQVRSTQGLASATTNGVLSPRQLLAAAFEHNNNKNNNNKNNNNDDDNDDDEQSARAALQSPEMNQLLFGNLVNKNHGMTHSNKINTNGNFADAAMNETTEDTYTNNNNRTKNNNTTTPNRSAVDSELEVKQTQENGNDDVDSKSEPKSTLHRHTRRHNQKSSDNVETKQQQQVQQQQQRDNNNNNQNKNVLKNAQSSINSSRYNAVENPFRLAGAVGGRQSVFNRISYLPKQNPGYYIKLKELGKGSCATTYLVEWVPPGGQSVVTPYVTPEMILGSDKIKKKWAANQQKKIEFALSRANNNNHNTSEHHENNQSVAGAVVNAGAVSSSQTTINVNINNQKQQQQQQQPQSPNREESSATAASRSGGGTSPVPNNVMMNNQNDDVASGGHTSANSNNNKSNQLRHQQNNTPSQGGLGLLLGGAQPKDCPFFPTIARSEIRSKKCKLLRHRLFYPTDDCCFEDLDAELQIPRDLKSSTQQPQQKQQQLRGLPSSENENANSSNVRPLRSVPSTATTENNNNVNNNNNNNNIKQSRSALSARRKNSRLYSSSRRSISVAAASSNPPTSRKPFVTSNFEKRKLYVSNSVAAQQFLSQQRQSLAEQQQQENIFCGRNRASSLGADSSRQPPDRLPSLHELGLVSSTQQQQHRLTTVEVTLEGGDNTTPTDAAAASSSKSQENNNNNQRTHKNGLFYNNLLEDDLFDSNLLDFLEPDCFEAVFPKLNMNVFLNDLHHGNNNNNNNKSNNNIHDRSIQTGNDKNTTDNNNINNNNNNNNHGKNSVQQPVNKNENNAENPDSTPSATPTLTPTPSPATTITTTHNGNNHTASKSPALEVLGSIYERGKNVFVQQPENISFASASRQSQQSPKAEKLVQQKSQQQQQQQAKAGPSTEADGATISDVQKKKSPKKNNNAAASDDTTTTTGTTADSVRKDADANRTSQKKKSTQRKNDKNSNDTKENVDNRRRGTNNSNLRQRNLSLNSSLITLNWGPHQISKECVDLLRPSKPSCLGVTTKTIPIVLTLDVPLVLLQHQDHLNNNNNNDNMSNTTISGGFSPTAKRLSSPSPQLQGITRKVVPPATVVAYPIPGGTTPPTGTIVQQRARLLQTQIIRKNVEVPRENIFVCKIETRADSDGYTVTPMTEKAVLANCAHPNIVGYVDSFADPVSEFLVMEYVDGGDLKQMLKNRIDAAQLQQQQQLPKNHSSSRRHSTNNNNNNEVAEQKYLSERSVLFLFVQMCMAVEYLHRHNMLHRDIKTANFLVSKKWLVKLADFGFAKQFNDVVNNLGNKDVDLNCTMTSLGTPYYMAPEMIQRASSSSDGIGQHTNVGYSDKADMWALGVVLYELVTLQKPFPGPNVDDVIARVLNNEPTPLPRNSTSEQFQCSEQLRTLIRFLLSKRPEKRPSAKQVLQLPFMVDAMSRYVEKYSAAAVSSQCAQDTVWAQILKEHQQLILADNLTGPKSTRRIRQEIRESVQGFTSVMSGVSKRKMSVVENDSSSSSTTPSDNGEEDEDEDEDDDEEDEEEEEEEQEDQGKSQK